MHFLHKHLHNCQLQIVAPLSGLHKDKLSSHSFWSVTVGKGIGETFTAQGYDKVSGC